jgi:hypothetical protein
MNPIQLDTSAVATDTIDYVATDAAGLAATSTRTVLIEPANAHRILKRHAPGLTTRQRREIREVSVLMPLNRKRICLLLFHTKKYIKSGKFITASGGERPHHSTTASSTQ